MANRIAFGNTWWGKRWIEALEQIDINENRLPRGRSYARNESVKEINFTGNLIQAKVKGRKPSPYSIKISLSKFNNDKTDKILEVIREYPAIASELSLGRLPEELLNLLEKSKIRLLPESYEDFKSNCSCPDWANPCKHIAAVYYLLGREIDKNPFILFNLRGISTDQLTGLTEIRSKKERKIYSLKNSFLPKTKIKPRGLDTKFSASLNFPEFDVNSLLTLLPEKPLFYASDDFKKLLKNAYQDSSYYVSNLAIDEEIPRHLKSADFTLIYSGNDAITPHVFVTDKEIIHIMRPKFRTKLEKAKLPALTGGKIQIIEKEGAHFSLGEIISFLKSLPALTDLEFTSESGRFMSICTVMSLAILKTHSFLPHVLWKDEDEFTIRYIPHFHHEKLTQAFSHLEKIFPVCMGYNKANGQILSMSGLQDILSQFIATAFHSSLSGNDMYISDKTRSVFFSDDTTYVPERFDEKNTGKAIADWLERFSSLREDIAPVIQIDEDDKSGFSLSIFAENKKDSINPPLPLSRIFGREKMIFDKPAAIVRNGFSRQVAIAGEYLPELKSVLNAKGMQPARINLKRIGEILKEHSAFIEYLGIRFILPKAFKNLLKPKLELFADSKSKTISYLNLDTMLKFSWRISVGDKELTEQEFRELLKKSEGIAEFKGQYIILDPEETKRLLHKLDSLPDKSSSMEILRAALTGEWDGVPFISDEKLKELLEALGKTEEINLPEGISAELRPYQLRGYQWMYSNLKKGFGCCIADDMGLGKTIQVIAILQKLKNEGILKGKALIVCPTTLIGNWFKELEKFAPSLKALIYHGTEKSLNVEDMDIVITTYGLIRRYNEKFADYEWDILVIDEAQNIKNPMTDQTNALKSVNAKYKIAMSGTPVENRLTELWSIFDFLNRGYLGHLKVFREDYALLDAMIKKKKELANLTVSAGETWITEMSNDQLKEIFSLQNA